MIKIEDGLFTGEILYHKQVVKTEEELAAIKVQREEKRRLKLERKKIQSENVDRKLNEKQKSKRQGNDDDADDRTDDDDDAAYYKEEVGEEPDKGGYLQFIDSEILNLNVFQFVYNRLIHDDEYVQKTRLCAKVCAQ